MRDFKHTPVTLTELHKQPARAVFISLSIGSAYAKVRPAYINNLPIIWQHNSGAAGIHLHNAITGIDRLQGLGFKHGNHKIKKLNKKRAPGLRG